MNCEEKVSYYCRQAVTYKKYAEMRRCDKCCIECKNHCDYICERVAEDKDNDNVLEG